MKKSVIILALALVAFSNFAEASSFKSVKKDQVQSLSGSESPLHEAIFKGDFESVKKFIQYGADVNKVFRDMSPLMVAARFNRVEIAKLLLKSGAKVSFENEKGFTALQYAEFVKAEDCIALLKGLK